MSKKLTLTLDSRAIEKAKRYARNKKVSLSRLVEYYFKSLSSRDETYELTAPPITMELSGIAKTDTKKSDREILSDSLNKRFL